MMEVGPPDPLRGVLAVDTEEALKTNGVSDNLGLSLLTKGLLILLEVRITITQSFRKAYSQHLFPGKSQ